MNNEDNPNQMRFHDFEELVHNRSGVKLKIEYEKSDIKIKIDSQEKFSQKELEQKEMILKEMNKKLQQKLAFYEKESAKQKSLLKEEEQKKVIGKGLNQTVSKNHKKETKKFLKDMIGNININIIPAVNSINQILKTDGVDENKKEHLKNIKTNLYDFLNDASLITEYQRIVQGDKSIHKIIVEPKKIIEKILSWQKRNADEKGVKITFENHNVKTIFCDEYKISLILNNLIKNSIDSCNKNSEIKIIVNENEKEGSISIVDTGNGFSSEFINEILSNQKITNPFAKENEIKTSMIILRMIIQNHGGRFKIVSQPGQKTEVSFTLPSRIAFSNKKNY